jgi:integrase
VRRELIDKNPFLHATVKYGKRDRVMSDEEIKALFAYDHPPFSHILKLCLLTGQRRSQISGIQQSWIKNETIMFPAEVMKGGRPHVLPFGPITGELLEMAPFQFNGWSKAKARCDKHTRVTDWTLHDLRRTFATIHARIGTPIHVVEALLDHSSGAISGVAAIYIRHNFLPEMRRSMQEFETTIRTLVDQ